MSYYQYQAPAYPTTEAPATSSSMMNNANSQPIMNHGLPPLHHPDLPEGAGHPRPKHDRPNGHNEGQQPSQGPYTQATMRTPSIPFGYPSNLNQYGQHYDPYGHYAAYHKDQMMPQSYVVSYPPMGYPVLVSGNNSNGNENPNNDQQQQQQQQQPYPPSAVTQQHFNGMLQQPRSFAGSHFTPENAQTQVNYQQQQEQRSSPEAKKEQESHVKSEPMTPVPSASASSAAPPAPAEATEDEERSKFALLSQLCSAALHQDHNRTENNNSQQQS
ncbi:hypothetical protein DFQ28_001616 [Apophysomyces sp. BC1034]|nr:hypothetical protein DFQ29_001034 [Apophysomyces sp. BC1021]KAG0190769.1 hypothetical protein DFQ28_001616 [Apophysomyces sp. BC1034]